MENLKYRNLNLFTVSATPARQKPNRVQEEAPETVSTFSSPSSYYFPTTGSFGRLKIQNSQESLLLTHASTPPCFCLSWQRFLPSLAALTTVEGKVEGKPTGGGGVGYEAHEIAATRCSFLGAGPEPLSRRCWPQLGTHTPSST